MAVTWCDPPDAGPRRWWTLLEEVMDRPGEWGLVRRYPRPLQASRAQQHLQGGRSRKPPGRWEFRSGQIKRNVPGWGVWAKWEPEP